LEAPEAPATMEEVMARARRRLGLHLTPELCLFSAGAVKGHLSALRRRERAQFAVEDHRPVWRKR